ncbi:MAG TPA: hypothetical protein VF272_02815, partial [Candidatus Saccharimonadia bacterium]
MKPLRAADTATQALLFVGTAHFLSQGFTQAKNSRKPVNSLAIAYMGLLSAAALYQAGRLIGPKTREEK